MDNVGELMNMAAAYNGEHPFDFRGFVAALLFLADQKRANEEEDAVTLMSIHSAKGLEFDNVYVAGMIEKYFPSVKAIDEGNLEEERRLCYVALTRARQNLMLLTTAQRRMYGSEELPFNPSRFLKEISPGLVDVLLEAPLIDLDETS